MEIFQATLKLLGAEYLIANYNPDHPFIISSRGSGNANILKNMMFYDIHFCYSSQVVQQISRQYKLPSVYLPFGFELSKKQIEDINIQVEVLKVCFIGNPDQIRRSHLEYLLNKSFAIDVYGKGWDRFLDKKRFPKLEIFPAVFGNAFWRTIRKYRVQLNIFRPHNKGSHNMRTFEVPAVGGIMLSQNSPEHQEFFQDNKEAFFYNDMEEMANKATNLLGLNHEDVIKIRHAAMNRCQNSRYAYKDRTQLVVESFRELLNS